MSSRASFPPITAQVDGHDLEFLIEPEARLARLLSTIDAARTELRLYFYIFADGEVARSVIEALIDARNRGVVVTLLVDGFGSEDQPDSLYDPLREAGVRFARFFPRYGRRYLIRNHQKMLIADDRRAIIGGFNIEDRYFIRRADGEWWQDLLLSVEGDAVGRLLHYYDALAGWMTSDTAGLRALNTILSRHSEATGAVRWVFGGPFRRISPLTRAIRSDIVKASSVDMIEAYFAPNWAWLRKLGRVAHRGRFRLVTASRTDNHTTVAAARHCYRGILRRGGEIYEFLPAWLHTKLIVSDSAVYAGSANFDMRSLYLNTELMLRIEDEALAEQVRGLVSGYCHASKPVTRQLHKARTSFLTRLRQLAAHLVITALDYRLSRNLNWRQDD